MRLYQLLSAASLGLAPLAAASAQPAPAALTAEQWRSDLAFMVNELRIRHPNLHHHVTKAEFDRHVAALERDIPRLQRHQIIAGMMRIAALIGDGHTRVDPRKDPAFQLESLPVQFYLFDDGLWVRAAKPSHQRLLGARVERVGGVPVEEAIRRVSDLASRENDMGPKLFAALYLAMPGLLHATGLSQGPDMAQFTLVKDGRRWTESLTADHVAAIWPPDTDISLITPKGWVDASGDRTPTWLTSPLDYHRLIAMPERKAIYAQLNMVTDTPGQSLEAFGERILADARAANPRAVILDMRLNYGGNGSLRNRFIPNLLRVEDSDTRLFVLTARGTFSASQFLLDDLERLSDAVLIGEAASSRATGYSDGYRSSMPNSKIAIRTSVKYWQSGQDMRAWTPIDLHPAYRFADYAAGRDPALEAALSFAPSQLLEDRLLRATSVEQLTAIGDDPLYRYADFNRATQLAVQKQMRAGDKAGALRLSRWLAKRLPKEADAETLLAIVADSNGESDEAKAAARRTLALDPNNRQVRSILER